MHWQKRPASQPRDGGRCYSRTSIRRPTWCNSQSRVRLPILGAIRRLTRFSFEELQPCASTWQDMPVGVQAVVDIVVTTPIPVEKTAEITDVISRVTMTANSVDDIRRVYWAPCVQGPNSLILFLGECKKAPGSRNQNRLLVDFRTAQWQRYTLGLPDAVIWDAACAMGRFQVYSSMWRYEHSVCPGPHIRRSLFSQVHFIVFLSGMEPNYSD